MSPENPCCGLIRLFPVSGDLCANRQKSPSPMEDGARISSLGAESRPECSLLSRVLLCSVQCEQLPGSTGSSQSLSPTLNLSISRSHPLDCQNAPFLSTYSTSLGSGLLHYYLQQPLLPKAGRTPKLEFGHAPPLLTHLLWLPIALGTELGFLTT